MVNFCKIKQCRHIYGKVDQTNKKIRLHKFPDPEVNPGLFNMWVEATGLRPTKGKHGFAICTRHFHPRNLYQKSGFLKPNAVPFIPNRMVTRPMPSGRLPVFGKVKYVYEHNYAVPPRAHHEIEEVTPKEKDPLESVEEQLVYNDNCAVIKRIVSVKKEAGWKPPEKRTVVRPPPEVKYAKVVQGDVVECQFFEREEKPHPELASANARILKLETALTLKNQELEALQKEIKEEPYKVLGPYFTKPQIEAYKRETTWERMKTRDPETVDVCRRAHRFLGARGYNFLKDQIKIPLLSRSALRIAMKHLDPNCDTSDLISAPLHGREFLYIKTPSGKFRKIKHTPKKKQNSESTDKESPSSRQTRNIQKPKNNKIKKKVHAKKRIRDEHTDSIDDMEDILKNVCEELEDENRPNASSYHKYVKK